MFTILSSLLFIIRLKLKNNYKVKPISGIKYRSCEGNDSLEIARHYLHKAKK